MEGSQKSRHATRTPAFLAAPVRLELTTHGLTAIKGDFKHAEPL